MNTTRTAIYVLGAVAAVTLALLVVPFFALGDDLRTWVTWVFWGSFVALLVALYLAFRSTPGSDDVEVDGPPFARFLFNNRKAGLFWLPIRIYLGVSWIDASLHKLTSPAWTQGGDALLGYWERAVVIPETGSPPITYDWYRDFINFLISIDAQTWFSWVIMFGELAVGLGLLLGALTGVAAFFGALMNMSFLLAGSSSTNPVLFTMAIGIMLAWKVAGYYGLDRYLLPRLGTPWHRGTLTSSGARTPDAPPPEMPRTA